MFNFVSCKSILQELSPHDIMSEIGKIIIWVRTANSCCQMFSASFQFTFCRHAFAVCCVDCCKPVMLTQCDPPVRTASVHSSVEPTTPNRCSEISTGTSDFQLSVGSDFFKLWRQRKWEQKENQLSVIALGNKGLIVSEGFFSASREHESCTHH